MIFRFVRPSKVNDWLKTNFPSAIRGTPGDNWKKFLEDNGGTGETFHDLETSYLNQTGKTLTDRWSSFVKTAGYSVGVFRDRMRAYFEGVVSASNSYYLMEDGSSKYQLEDGSGFYILE
ncbi:hypothetical protein [Caudoviricetes sp.]|nr:hypothetical protein [Caudoviricetes sp.]